MILKHQQQQQQKNLLWNTMWSFQKNEVALYKLKQNILQDVLFSEKQRRDFRYTNMYVRLYVYTCIEFSQNITETTKVSITPTFQKEL